jgi:hypothetical protein
MSKDEISLLISALNMSKKDDISFLCKCNNTVLLFLLQKKIKKASLSPAGEKSFGWGLF